MNQIKRFFTLRFVQFVLVGLAVAAFSLMASADKVKITYGNWEYGAEQVAMHKELVSAFNASQTEVEVEFRPIKYDSIVVELAADTAPDVLNSYRETTLGPQGALLDLSNYVAAEDAFIQEEALVPSALSYFNVAGGLWGVPAALSVEDFTYYNIELFDQAGLNYPDETWTWDTFLAAAKRLTIDKNGDGTPDQYGIPYQWSRPLPGWIYANGGKEWLGDGSGLDIETPEAREALQFLASLQPEHGVVAPLGSPAVSNQVSSLPFSSGHIGMSIGANWETSVYANVKDLKWDVAPPLIGKRRGVRIVAFPLDIKATSPHKDAAWKFVRWMSLSPEANKIVAEYKYGVPVLREAAFTLQGPMRKIAEYASKWGWVAPPYPGRDNVHYKIENPEFRKAFEGQKSLGNAIDSIMQQVKVKLPEWQPNK